MTIVSVGADRDVRVMGALNRIETVAAADDRTSHRHGIAPHVRTAAEARAHAARDAARQIRRGLGMTE